MRTTVNLPTALVEEARALLGLSNKTEVVVTALRELVRARQREALKALAGQVEIEVDVDGSRRRTVA